jgi:L,D-peptidoglycan transpeptidase YkuD (ErfK/YbiS/YcfS/YnhG family)
MFQIIAVGQIKLDSLPIPKRHQQVILVTASSWNAPTGTLLMFNKTSSGWKAENLVIPVSLGKNGMAWGKGLHLTQSNEISKKEGDGKAPAGIFEIGTFFGYVDILPVDIQFPYRQTTKRDYFVDATNSVDYNTWQTIPDTVLNNPKNYWSSYERMKRSDHLYELGFIINHNVNPIMKGAGSAIFFHVWRSPNSPTLGCTASSRENLLKIMKWINPKMNPLVIQVPESELNSLKFKK